MHVDNYETSTNLLPKVMLNSLGSVHTELLAIAMQTNV